MLIMASRCLVSVSVWCSRKLVYMTTHQQDSSQPQQSHDSPHLGAGEGLMMVETVEAMLEGMFVVLCSVLVVVS
jgi:hypothetical protein